MQRVSNIVAFMPIKQEFKGFKLINAEVQTALNTCPPSSQHSRTQRGEWSNSNKKTK
jgi:hypothetical protein